MYHFPSPGVVDGLDTIGYVANSNVRLIAGVRKIKIWNSKGAKEKNEFKRTGRMAASIDGKIIKCIVNFCGKCQRQLTKIRPGSGLGKVT